MLTHPIQPNKMKTKILLNDNSQFCDRKLTMVIFSYVFLHLFFLLIVGMTPIYVSLV